MTTTPSPSTSPDPRGERVQKILAHAGVASRRHAEEMIAAGRVRVDGVVLTEPGTRVGPTALIEVDGRPVERDAPRRYLLLNKPAGYLTTVTDPHGRATVMEFVAGEAPGLFPVGRLDRDSEGLLILTDDGELANLLTHPRYHVPKTYEVLVEGVPASSDIRRLEQGIALDDGPTAPAEVSAVRRTGEDASLMITLFEGRKRQVRRMCHAIGHPVKRLVRTRFGPLSVEGLTAGTTRRLDPGEISRLREAARQ